MKGGYIISWGGYNHYWFKELQDAAAFARLWNAGISPTSKEPEAYQSIITLANHHIINKSII